MKKTLVLSAKINFCESLQTRRTFKSFSKLESISVFWFNYSRFLDYIGANKFIKWFNYDKNKYLTKIFK